MGKLLGKDKGVDQVYQRISDILSDARGLAWQAVNTAMVSAYWEIGRIIVEEEQKGESRAEYGIYMLDVLSERLTADFGKGFGNQGTLPTFNHGQHPFIKFQKRLLGTAKGLSVWKL